MADLYDSGTNFPAEINARHPSGLDLMATTGNIPRLSLGHLVGLGWVPDNWVRSFDFSKVELGDSLILQSTESLGHRGPSPGHVAGIDIRIGAGWSYLSSTAGDVWGRWPTSVSMPPSAAAGTGSSSAWTCG